MRQSWDTPGFAYTPGRFSNDAYASYQHDLWLARLSHLIIHKPRPPYAYQGWCAWCKKEPKYARGLGRRCYQRWLRRYARGTTGLVGVWRYREEFLS